MVRKVVSTADICGGSPRLDDTRLTCANIVLNLYKEKMSFEDFFKIYDYLNFDDIVECIKYCRSRLCIKNNVIEFCQQCTLFSNSNDDEIKNEQKSIWEYANEIFYSSMSSKIQHSKVIDVRMKTGYGMMDCLKALKIVYWDVNKAVKLLEDKPPVYLS